MIWWAMIVSNLLWGLSIALLLDWAGVRDFMGGMTKAGMYGFILMLSWDLSLYSMSTWYKDMTGVCIDVIAGTVMITIIGGVVGMMLGKGK